MINFFKQNKEFSLGSIFIVAAVLVQFLLVFPYQKYVYVTLYMVAYLFVGGPVWVQAIKSILKGSFYTEFFLMGIATLGAFILGEYLEGVAVMYFYMIGEIMQHDAVDKARDSIGKLVEQQQDTANVERNGILQTVPSEEVMVGEEVVVRSGEKIPLDGVLMSSDAVFDFSMFTGESKPVRVEEQGAVYAGLINNNSTIRVKVESEYKDSRLSNILNMVEKASQRKAPTQRFMSKFARIYTPIVVWLAVALTFIPYLVVVNYVFQDWFYKALIFLVVSCPCGLVISIPLGYFGGIGAASQNGILLKGSDYLDRLRSMDVLFVDKTGTLTEGTFEIQEIDVEADIAEEDLMQYAASLEQYSTHPIAKAILNKHGKAPLLDVDNHEEISGKGLKGIIENKTVLAGNAGLMQQFEVEIPENRFNAPYTYVHIAIDGKYMGTISIADTVKTDAAQTIAELRGLGVKKVVMLSGDNQKVVDYVAAQVGIDQAFGELMPEDKYSIVEKELSADKTVAFVGDGINDAPVITLADVGIAMGAVGADATIETADVVIQTDQPSKIPLAINISRFTHRIVWENIGFAMGTKVLVMGLATIGLANLWMAIFADVGVAIIAIANAIRVQNRYSDRKISLSFKKVDHHEQESSVAAVQCCSTH